MIRGATALGASLVGLTLLLPASSAVAGRSLTAPATASFGAALDGTDTTASFSLALTATVTNPSTAGWNLTIRATRLTGPGGRQLPVPSVTAVGWACQATCTTNPSNSVAPPLTIPTGTPAVKFFNAAANTGIGAFTVTPTIAVAVPANVRAGTYTSTITTAIVAGP